MSKRRRKKLSADPVMTTISRLSYEGRGIAEINGKTTFIAGALADETIRFRYTKCRSQFDEGEAIEVITPSIQRVDPICPHFGICGGCSLQHMDHDAQIAHKQSALLSLLRKTPPKNLLEPLIANTFGYRRKARIGVKFVAKKAKVLVGFREKNAPYVTDMQVCHTLHPDVGQAIDKLSELLMTLECKTKIPQLEIAVGDDATAIIVRHLIPLPNSDLTKLIDFFKDRQWHLYCQPNNTDSIYRIYPTEGKECLHYFLDEYNLQFQYHPTQFTQINHNINQQMVARALELLDLQENDLVLDLFCGIGNFSLPIAQYCQKVIGIEDDANAVAQAKLNAKQNQLSNIEFYTANLFEAIVNDCWLKQAYTKILLDPPRSGAKEIVDNITLWAPQRIVYVSCNPATLARDAEILCKQGYYLSHAGIMDMFPHTAHVETMSLFIKSC